MLHEDPERSRPKPTSHVVAAVIHSSDGRVLLSLRRDHAEHGGLWEFPGGKLQAHERRIDGLARELHEELGITIGGGVPLIRIYHEYTNQFVLLDVWEITRWHDEPRGRENQEIKWVHPRELDEYRFPDANKTVVSACRLPRVQLITPPPGAAADRFLSRLSVCLAAGVSMVQLRAKPHTTQNYRLLAKDVLRICRSFQARLILNADPADVLAVDADGIQLPSARLAQLTARPLDTGYIVGASCHDIRELEHAKRLDVDFVLVSPVRETTSHPEARPIGWSGLRRLVERTPIPAYALGGLELDDLDTAVSAGCQGVAMIRGIWFNDKPDRMRALIDAALSRAAQGVSTLDSATPV